MATYARGPRKSNVHFHLSLMHDEKNTEKRKSTLIKVLIPYYFALISNLKRCKENVITR